MLQHWEILKKFCLAQRITETGVPLFDASAEGVVSTVSIGRAHPRMVLCRSAKMEALVLRETDKLVEDWKSRREEYDGLIYLMYTVREHSDVIPLYIGKAETLGTGGGNLSANLSNLHRNKSKFARWGDDYAYHIGDLSAAAVVGHPHDKVTTKYTDWASQLFVEFPRQRPKLKRPVYFWAKAWRKCEVGIWEDFGSTRLTFLEYLLIGVASSAYPESLLNREGQNRTSVGFEKHNKTTSQIHVIIACRNCSQKLRLPKGKGVLKVSCPKCRTQFSFHT